MVSRDQTLELPVCLNESENWEADEAAVWRVDKEERKA